jgi:aryl-alcohol dehydrogenase-like predicted oxidoreductase
MIEPIRIADSTVTISRVGLGCAGLNGGSELRRSARLIETALSAGIRHFDTAPVYGQGKSEDVLGQVLSGVADITLTTKIGIARPAPPTAPSPARLVYRRFVKPLLKHMPDARSKILQLLTGEQDGFPGPTAPLRKLDVTQIRRELEESLKWLKRDRVDLYLIHEPDQFELDDEALETFVALKHEGVIGAFGLAFGRSAGVTPNFGTLIQSQYRSDCATQTDYQTRIFHGVLRYGWNEFQSKTERAGDVGEYFKSVLHANPKAAIVFSASSPRQILEVTSEL